VIFKSMLTPNDCSWPRSTYSPTSPEQLGHLGRLWRGVGATFQRLGSTVFVTGLGALALPLDAEPQTDIADQASHQRLVQRHRGGPATTGRLLPTEIEDQGKRHPTHTVTP
jgi:hypothetical protein